MLHPSPHTGLTSANGSTDVDKGCRPTERPDSPGFHDAHLCVRDSEERPAQPLSDDGRGEREGGILRQRADRGGVPAGDRREVQHSLPAQRSRHRPPGQGGGVPRGRQDAGLPGRLRELPQHVPAHGGEAGGRGLDGARRTGPRGGPGGLRLQHHRLPAREPQTPHARELRRLRQSRPGLRSA
ncbi:hypothetical protein COCON_G00199380 [Conger conger]|uniref:Uncharacterized protein n=1 Tax=Conger conger TaxID=82655 RepID=A0A9Q1D242_CONCO|nr:hypothetical protein COCON_G00199380 [Conger conger]